MPLDIQRDQRRFKQIVRGKVRENLRRYISHGEMIGRKGKDLVSIPLPQLDVPRFRFGDNGNGGVGQGDGADGQPVSGGRPGTGQGPAGSDPGGGHLLEVELTMEELADIMGDELGLPRIEPKGTSTIEQQKSKYNSVRSTGPESLRHKRRTYMRALRRQISTGGYLPHDPQVVPLREDRRYRSWNTVDVPQANAVVIYMMDVSGSMTDEQKQIVRTAAFWIDTWLARNYAGIEKRYIIHDAAAKEVDEHTFYRTRESGGTRISSAYKVCAELIERSFPIADWNIYCFQFSDGDNWGDDNSAALRILEEKLLPACNLYCYGQVESPYGSGEFMGHLEGRFGDSQEKLVSCEIEDREAILDSIKVFLGSGR